MRRVAAIVVLLACSFVALTAQGKKPAARRAEAVKAEPAPPQRPAPSAAMLKPFAARSIGPAVMGGRVSDIAFDPQRPVDLLRRHRARRPDEDDRQRRRRSPPSPTSSCRLDRRSRRRAIRPEDRVGSAAARPTIATARAGATASTARPTAARRGPRAGLRGTQGHRAHRGAPDRPGHRVRRGGRRPLERQRRARALQDDRRRARPGSRCCRRRLPTTSHRVRRGRDRPAEPRHACTRCSTRGGARPGRSTRAST